MDPARAGKGAVISHRVPAAGDLHFDYVGSQPGQGYGGAVTDTSEPPGPRYDGDFSIELADLCTSGTGPALFCVEPRLISWAGVGVPRAVEVYLRRARLSPAEDRWPWRVAR